MAKPHEKPMSLEEFLIWEAKQEEKYEYDDGVIIMMTGGMRIHNLISGGVYATLRQQLAGKSCIPHFETKIICPNRKVRYPDVSVDCGPWNPKDTYQKTPTLVVEVLSPSSGATDYLRKTRDYASVPSIDIYLIVNPDSPIIDVFRRVGDALEMQEQAQGLDAIIDLPSIGAKLALADIYPPDAA
jgi:Uma2 family endonuclease